VNPRFPVYIVSKGRADSRLTSRFLERMSVPYHIIVEAQEFDAYAAVIDPKKILVLPAEYQDGYDTFDKLGATKSRGPGPARNFAWEHSISVGAEWHWVVDDNIRGFCRMNNNVKLLVTDGTIFVCMEDFALRYKNIVMAGPNYWMFLPRKRFKRPLTLNTRIYSCNLIRNDLPFRWRGRYNEDTDLSLRMLKAGWCTVLFNAFVQIKAPTQTVKGGCDTDFYKKEGTKAKSEMLYRMHPDVTKLVWKFRRYHHSIDYKPFAGLKLVPKPGVEIGQGVNDYGMHLIHEPPPWYSRRTKEVTTNAS
jgi:hypothetical protein